MADMFDYLKWRGDILFSQVPLNEVDSLILSALVYIKFDEVVSESLYDSILLKDAANEIMVRTDAANLVRVKQDLELLKIAAKTERFGNIRLSFYKNIFIPKEETQFAAITYYLDDGSVFLAFRGTDNTLVGWKEDFNMTFQESIPSQRLAQEYIQEFAAFSEAPMRLGGHSKGGNLAVYAAAKCEPEVQKRIAAVYNHDGPGFTEKMLVDEGYLAIIPKIHTYVPQSSLFGMLLERKEAYTVIRSKQIGILQHDPYTWEVLGKGFIILEKRTGDSYFMDRTFENWLAGMTMEERNELFDAVFELLGTGGVNSPKDIMKPQNIRNYLKTLKMDDHMRRVILSRIIHLMKAARDVNRKNDVKTSDFNNS